MPPKLFVKLVEITPTEAKRMLDTQAHNRNLSRSRVSQMAEDMTHHRWVPNGESIKLDVNGKLIDGQHRLAAAVKSNYTLPTLLVSGLDPSTAETIDQGARRSPANALQLLKPPVKSAVLVASAVGIIWQFEKFGMPSSGSGGLGRPSRAQFMACFRKNRGLEDSCRLAWVLRKHCGQWAPSQIAALHYLLMQREPVKAAKFFDCIAGAGDDKIPAVTLLLNRLRGHRLRNRFAPMALAIKAWNAYYSGKRVGQIKFNANESFPDIEGRAK